MMLHTATNNSFT